MEVDAVGGDPAPSVVETHSGVVVFLGDRAYKMKKHVDLGFLDFRSRRAREAISHREVELNRRLAPDVYLGVSDVLDTSGEPCEHLVVMRRMPDGRRLSALVEAGADVTGRLDELAGVIAAFHARAERSEQADIAAGVDALAERWSSNTRGLRPFTGRFVEGSTVELVDELAHRYLAGRRPLVERRIASGRACDGHGDLLADDVFCLDDGPRVLDCLEFDDTLRLDDALADVAFLAMDLERLGRPDLAERFLATYRSEAGDDWPASLLHHHVAYRAQVRAKVAAIRADQRRADSDPQPSELLALAHRHLEAGRVRLVLVGGLPGTGKSTLAAGLGSSLHVPVLRSDEIRKRLAGLRPEQSSATDFGEGIYTSQRTEVTYGEMLDRARSHLGLGESVILDASWTDDSERGRARALAEETSSDLVELECRAPAEVAAARMRDRARTGGDPSDADAAIAASMSRSADPWPTATPVDTSTAVDTSLEMALAAVTAPWEGSG